MRTIQARDAHHAAREAATLLAAFAREAVADHGAVSVAISGGRAPWEMFAALGETTFPWADATFFQVDERVVSATSSERNWTKFLAAIEGHTPTLCPMPVEDILAGCDPDEACAAYAQLLPEQFDVIHLGLGPDGHTASLVPGDSVLGVTDHAVAMTGCDYQGTRRMTLTYPTLNAAHQLLYLVTGEEKADALARLRSQDPTIPAGRVLPDHAVAVTELA